MASTSTFLFPATSTPSRPRANPISAVPTLTITTPATETESKFNIPSPRRHSDGSSPRSVSPCRDRSRSRSRSDVRAPVSPLRSPSPMRGRPSHQRSRSTSFIRPDFSADNDRPRSPAMELRPDPSYARSTELSRRRARSKSVSDSRRPMTPPNNNNASSDTTGGDPTMEKKNQNLPRTELTGPAVQPQQSVSTGPAHIVKFNYVGQEGNVLRVSAEEGYMFSLRIISQNEVEISALPAPQITGKLQESAAQSQAQDSVCPLIALTPPCSPSTAKPTYKALDMDLIGEETPTLVVQEDVPRKAHEHLEALQQFVREQQLEDFFPDEVDKGILKELSERAAACVTALTAPQTSQVATDAEDKPEDDCEEEKEKADEESVQIPKPVSFIQNPTTVAELTKLSLYDHVIFCDDSASMKWYNRVDALKETLIRLTNIAITLRGANPKTVAKDGKDDERSGISVRFLDFKRNAGMDNITSISEVEDIFRELTFSLGSTPLGTRLMSEVIEPLIVRKVAKRKDGDGRVMKRPMLVTIITDGEPNMELHDAFGKSIRTCKQFMEEMGYGAQAVRFHIVQVGTCTGAEKFLQSVQDDPQVGPLVHVTREKIRSASDVDSSADLSEQQKKTDELWWINELLQAIHH